MKNKSAPYGYYGGVTNANHYVPSPSTPFVPQPASVPFYENQATATAALLSSADSTREFFEQNEGAIMRRYFTGIVNNQEVYEIKTLDNPNDLIIYTTPVSAENVLNVTVMDGGYF
jgi:hypothetical protein